MNNNKENIQLVVPKLRFPEFKNDWEKVKLKDLSTYFNGKSFEGNVQKEGKYELITLKSIDTNGNLVHSKRYINDEVPTLAKGTLVMILSEQAPGLLGMTAIIPLDKKYVLNQRVAEIRPNNKVKSYFLSMAINRNQRIFSRLGAGMKVQNISKPNVENYEFYYPTLAEQQKIANTLSSLDNYIKAETEKLNLLKDHKKGLLQQLFPANGEKVPKKRFPEFVNDGDWEEKRLGDDDVSIIIMGASPKSSYYNKNRIGLPLLQGNADIKNRFSSPRIYTSQVTKECQINDILLSVRAPVGTVAKSLHKACIGRGISVIRAVKNNSQEYLYQWLISFEPYWKNISQGGTFDAVNSDDIRRLKIPLPTPKEQQKIANTLTSVDELIEAQTLKIDHLQNHKKGLMQGLFPNTNNVAL